MSIQELVRCDSIVAPKLLPADFCNNIGTKRQWTSSRRTTALRMKAELDYRPKAEPGGKVPPSVSWLQSKTME
jgi:hypothetical protein